MKTKQLITILLLITSIQSKAFLTDKIKEGTTHLRINSSLRDSLIELCYDDAVLAMKSLNNAQLYGVWLEKLNQAKNSGVNDSIEYYIQLVIDEISMELYDTTNLSAFLDFNTFVEGWMVPASVHIPDSSMINIFCHIYDFVPGEGGSIPYYENPPECNCNKSSLFGACQIFGNDCKTQQCTYHTLGCGFIGAYQCNGKCDDVPRPTYPSIPCY